MGSPRNRKNIVWFNTSLWYSSRGNPQKPNIKKLQTLMRKESSSGAYITGGENVISNRI
jgi:hypothetical protein